MKNLLLLLAALVAAPAFGQVTSSIRWELRLDNSTTGIARYTTQAACDAAGRARGVNATYQCPRLQIISVVGTPAPCTVLSSSTSAARTCPNGTTGSWQQTTTVTVGAPPACTVTTVVAPQTAPTGSCTPIVVTPPPAGAVTYHFSDCQTGAVAGCTPGNNSNLGTPERPKQTLAGINVNALPAGSRLLFARGGAWLQSTTVLNNPNTTEAAPLVFDAYGTGPAPWLKSSSGNMFHLGGNWENTTDDGGYTFRNLKLDGMGTAEWGFWFVHTVRDVVIENNEITGFRIALNSNDSASHGVRRIAIRNNNIHHNRAMGMLGHYNDIVIEGNLIEANNFSGSGFDHGTYIGGGNNITIRNNRYIRNSVVNGVCQGGNMTFHGQINGLLVEGNRIEQDAGAAGCWLMSVTRGYTSAEFFRNAVIRNNKLINGGNTAMAVQSAPGVVVEGNVAINTRPTGQTGFSIGVGPTVPTSGGDAGDVGDTGAIVRNNTACQSGGATGNVVSVNSPGGTVANNVTVTGAAATTGVCAR
jgi:hypothetical protein